MREMAQAYATIANGGASAKRYVSRPLKDSDGIYIFQADTKGEKVLDTALTQAATDVMKGVVYQRTGRLGPTLATGSRSR